MTDYEFLAATVTPEGTHFLETRSFLLGPDPSLWPLPSSAELPAETRSVLAHAEAVYWGPLHEDPYGEGNL